MQKRLEKYFFISVISVLHLLYFAIQYGISTDNHFNVWTAAKLYPALALSEGYDLYECDIGPVLLTQYGPGSPLFYLSSCFGSSPEISIWIACILNTFSILTMMWFIFGKRNNSFQNTISIFIGFAFIFMIVAERTTYSLFQIHHDLPVLVYLFIGSVFLLSKRTRKNFAYQTLGYSFIWMAVWTKIVALPWLFLPIIHRLMYKDFYNYKNLSTTIYSLLGTGISCTLIFSFFFGFSDIWFHLFESTNTYPWRDAKSLFGNNNELLVSNNFLSKIVVLLKISFFYFTDYWWLVISCLLIFLQNFTNKENPILSWLILIYFLSVPTCLAALSKFGGVDNSLVFAHVPAYAAIFLKITHIFKTLTLSNFLKFSIAMTITLLPLINSLRIASSLLKDTSNSPNQLAYEYLLKNPKKPVFFALAPLPNFFLTGKISSAGEALTYTTMMSQDSLPKNAGLEFMQNTNLIAFGNPPYSRSYFDRKLNLTKIVSPVGLEDWNVYEAKRKE